MMPKRCSQNLEKVESARERGGDNEAEKSQMQRSKGEIVRGQLAEMKGTCKQTHTYIYSITNAHNLCMYVYCIRMRIYVCIHASTLTQSQQRKNDAEVEIIKCGNEMSIFSVTKQTKKKKKNKNNRIYRIFTLQRWRSGRICCKCISMHFYTFMCMPLCRPN